MIHRPVRYEKKSICTFPNKQRMRFWKKSTCFEFKLYNHSLILKPNYKIAILHRLGNRRTIHLHPVCHDFFLLRHVVARRKNNRPGGARSRRQISSHLQGIFSQDGCHFISTPNTLNSLDIVQVGMCVWPLVATINFSFVPERNRVPFISVCSLLWTCFLAYMKQNNEAVEHKV